MNTSRIPVDRTVARELFGLFAVIESKRIILPLKGVECDFSITGGISEVSMTQIFRQDNERALNCEYLFPLPADASVFFCEADINGRLIRAQVKERTEARQLAAEKQAAGFRTALVESERENLFTLSLGNLQAGDLVILKLKYFQTIRSLAGMPSIEIPFCPGVRYIPGSPLLRTNQGKGVADDTDQVPDASRISPVRIDDEHPDAAYVEVRGTLEGKFVATNDLVSPSHPILVQRQGEEIRISLADKGDVPDRDFVLRWSEQATEKIASRVWVSQKDQGTYALLEIRAPKEAPQEREPVDFYFLVDRSGSMAGEKWIKAVEALQSCLKVLGTEDRAMVTFFDDRVHDFSDRPHTAKLLLADRRFRTIGLLGTGGGTQLGPALSHVIALASKHSATKCKNLILITDAQIGNESAMLELMGSVQDFPVHCFGIDVALNDSLLLALSRQQGGTFHSLNPRDDIEQAVTALGKTLGQPVLLDLRLGDGWETAEAKIPNLYAGQIHYASAHSLQGGKPMLMARVAASTQFQSVDLESSECSHEAPYLHWSRSRIRRLVAEEKTGEAIALSVKSNLICPLTAFIAWDESEKVLIATHELVQPNLAMPGSLKGLCLSSPISHASGLMARGDKAPRGTGSYYSSFSDSEPYYRRDDDEPVVERSLKKAAAPEPLGLSRLEHLLSLLCRKTELNGWEPLVQAILNWIGAATGETRRQRLEKSALLLNDLNHNARRYLYLKHQNHSEEVAQVQAFILQSLKDFVDALEASKT